MELIFQRVLSVKPAERMATGWVVCVDLDNLERGRDAGHDQTGKHRPSLGVASHFIELILLGARHLIVQHW